MLKKAAKKTVSPSKAKAKSTIKSKTRSKK